MNHLRATTMEIVGYFAALFIGISLGLIGGGGSILTVPVLVYLFGLSPLVAVSYSLFIVGSTSLVGAIGNLRQKSVDLRTVFIFGSASVITTILIRRFIIPLIPENIRIAGLETSFSFLTMILFASLMLFASFAMIKGRRNNITAPKANHSRLLLFAYGIVIGSITGFLGAGGGFLLIPALVLLLHLPMKTAIGSSLLIIAMNSLLGFAAGVGQESIGWPLVITITSIAIAGVFIGGFMGRKINGTSLRKGFGWFVLLMGIFIIVYEIISMF